MKKSVIVFVLLLAALAFSSKIESLILEANINLTNLRDIFIGVFAILSIIAVISLIFFIKTIKRVAKKKRQYTNITILSFFIFLILFLVIKERSFDEEGIKETIEEKDKFEDKFNNSYKGNQIENHKTFDSKWLGLSSLILLLFVFIGRKKLKRTKTEEKEIVSTAEQKNEAVVEYYKKAVLLLNKKGIPYKDSFTHWELENIVEKEEKEEIINSFAELTILFEKCKYSTKDINEKDVNRAIEMYEKIEQKVSKNA